MSKGQIVDLSKWRAPVRIGADVCVIGSGPGGGTAARILAEGGLDVVVLEEGPDRTGTQLTQRDAEMYDQLYMDRAGRATDDLSMSILQGRALGGGSVINVCDVVPIAEPILEYWVRAHGLTDFAPHLLRPHTKAAVEDLFANDPPRNLLSRPNLLLEQAASSLGWRGEYMRHNRVGCQGLGTCMLGCPIDAKRNVRMVSIPAALQAGARFYVRARAVVIDHQSAPDKRVVARSLDEKGYRETGEFEVWAKHVVIAANPTNTAHLLLRSGIGNEYVGRYLSLQPQLPLMVDFDEELRSFDGIPQSYAVTEFERIDAERGLWGWRIETIFATPGMVSSTMPFFGVAAKAAMRRYAHLAGSLVLVPDAPTGRVVRVTGPRPVITYHHPDEHKRRLREGAKAAARLWLAAGAREVLVPTRPPLRIRSERDIAQIDNLSLDAATAPLVSAHQQGGVRFAPSPRKGAAAPDGEVYGTRGIYVFDSSGFPSSSSSHTMTPIIAVSRYLSHRLLAHAKS